MSFRLAILEKPLRTQLWFAGTCAGLVLLTFIIGNAVLPADRAIPRTMVGHDFLAFYTGGTFVRDGRAGSLYDLRAVEAFQRDLMAREQLVVGRSFGPFWNPPFYAWVFVPLAGMPYPTALGAWVLINVIALCCAIFLMCRMFAERPLESHWRNWGLLVLLIIASMPFVQALNHAQNTFTSLLVLCLLVTFWRRGKSVLAGLCAGLLFYKPQLAAVLALVLVIDMGWRALAGLCIAGAALLAVTIFTLPGTLAQYLHQLPLNVREFQVDSAYVWERHATFKGFWRLLFHGREAGEMAFVPGTLWIVCAGVFGAALIVAVATVARRSREPRDGEGVDAAQRDRVIGATICTMPLLMPFYFDYDLLLLAIPAVLVARERLAVGNMLTGPDRWLARGWIALGAWLMINPPFARETGVNVNVLLLSALSGMMIYRVIVANRWGSVVKSFDVEEHTAASQTSRRRAIAD